jgi:hypothetical protein
LWFRNSEGMLLSFLIFGVLFLGNLGVVMKQVF